MSYEGTMIGFSVLAGHTEPADHQFGPSAVKAPPVFQELVDIPVTVLGWFCFKFVEYLKQIYIEIINFSCTAADCLFCTWPELCLASKLAWMEKGFTAVAKSMSRNLRSRKCCPRSFLQSSVVFTCA